MPPAYLNDLRVPVARAIRRIEPLEQQNTGSPPRGGGGTARGLPAFDLFGRLVELSAPDDRLIRPHRSTSPTRRNIEQNLSQIGRVHALDRRVPAQASGGPANRRLVHRHRRRIVPASGSNRGSAPRAVFRPARTGCLHVLRPGRRSPALEAAKGIRLLVRWGSFSTPVRVIAFVGHAEQVRRLCPGCRPAR